MAQTLTLHVDPHTPVVHGDSAQLVANMSALENLGRADLLAVAIIGFVHAVSGTRDYRTNHRQLIQDAEVFMDGISNIQANNISRQMLLVFAAMAWDLGYQVDVGLTTDVATILNEVRDLRSLPEETLGRIMLFMQWVSTTI